MKKKVKIFQEHFEVPSRIHQLSKINIFGHEIYLVCSFHLVHYGDICVEDCMLLVDHIDFRLIKMYLCIKNFLCNFSLVCLLSLVEDTDTLFTYKCCCEECGTCFSCWIYFTIIWPFFVI